RAPSAWGMPGRSSLGTWRWQMARSPRHAPILLDEHAVFLRALSGRRWVGPDLGHAPLGVDGSHDQGLTLLGGRSLRELHHVAQPGARIHVRSGLHHVQALDAAAVESAEPVVVQVPAERRVEWTNLLPCLAGHQPSRCGREVVDADEVALRVHLALIAGHEVVSSLDTFELILQLARLPIVVVL